MARWRGGDGGGLDRTMTQAPMVFAFDNEHPIGAVCRFPCRHCQETPVEIGTFTDSDIGETVNADHAPPLFIRRKATREEWLQYCKENAKSPYSEVCWAEYFYEVSSD